MKTNILYLILGIFITTSLAFTANSTGLITLKPAMPIQTISHFSHDGENINRFIKTNSKKYTVHKMESSENGYIVVMVRY